MDKFDVFVRKAAKLIADAPHNANKSDKICILSRRFRLGKEECNILLETLKKRKT